MRQIDATNLEHSQLGKHAELRGALLYASTTMQVSQRAVQGWVRKQTNSETLVETFPARYLHFCSDTGKLRIAKDSSFSFAEQVDVLFCSGWEVAPDMADFAFKFTLVTTSKHIRLYAANEREAARWTGELQKWQQVRPPGAELVAHQDKELIVNNEDHFVYLDNNFRVYLSRHLLCHQLRTKGLVIKRSKTNGFLDRHLEVDFLQKVITIGQPSQSLMVLAKDLVSTCKEYPFSQLTHVAL